MKLDISILKEVISGVSEISSRQKWVKEEAGNGEMRVGSFTRCHLEEKILFSDEILELINKPRQELGLIFGNVNYPWVSCISTCLKSRDTDCPLFQTFFKDVCTSNSLGK